MLLSKIYNLLPIQNKQIQKMCRNVRHIHEKSVLNKKEPRKSKNTLSMTPKLVPKTNFLSGEMPDL